MHAWSFESFVRGPVWFFGPLGYSCCLWFAIHHAIFSNGKSVAAFGNAPDPPPGVDLPSDYVAKRCKRCGLLGIATIKHHTSAKTLAFIWLDVTYP